MEKKIKLPGEGRAKRSWKTRAWPWRNGPTRILGSTRAKGNRDAKRGFGEKGGAAVDTAKGPDNQTYFAKK